LYRFYPLDRLFLKVQHFFDLFVVRRIERGPCEISRNDNDPEDLVLRPFAAERIQVEIRIEEDIDIVACKIVVIIKFIPICEIYRLRDQPPDILAVENII
jgi:hypothetical protein